MQTITWSIKSPSYLTWLATLAKWTVILSHLQAVRTLEVALLIITRIVCYKQRYTLLWRCKDCKQTNEKTKRRSRHLSHDNNKTQFTGQIADSYSDTAAVLSTRRYLNVTPPSSSIWQHLSYGLVRSKREYYHNCSLVVFMCSFL